MGDLEGKVAVITGGGTGIGLETAKLFAQQGADLVLAGRTANSLSHACDAIEHMMSDPPSTYFACDVSSYVGVGKLLGYVNQNFGRIDILVNNAGVMGPRKPLSAFDEKEWDEVMNYNVRSMYLMMGNSIKLMPKGSSIVNVASNLGMIGVPEMGPYSASKGAVIALTRQQAIELAPHIRVNCVSPSLIDTPMTQNYDPKLKKAIVDEHPIPRIGKPQEVAEAILYLASDRASWITGHNLVVDGGLTSQ